MDGFEELSLNDRRLIVAIDFGTTFSGVAWTETRRTDQQFVIDLWPANPTTREGHSSPKVPTELRYTANGVEWGAQIPSAAERECRFKLFLEDLPNTGSFVPKAHLTLGPASQNLRDRSPELLTTDYLRELYHHLMYTLQQKLGSAILRSVSLDFVLTVPAIWSEKAKDKTLRAAQNAGIQSDSEIIIVSEPEAAATYTLHSLDYHELAVGDTFVICDAGGGTVDLISYSILELHPKLRVREVAPGDGGHCGSSFLNVRFEEYLTGKLGQEEGWDEEILTDAQYRFENVVKRQFSTSSIEGYTFMVPGLANNPKLGVHRGRFTMTAIDLSGIFEPIIDEIIRLVMNQIDATRNPVRALLLVGGFGQNIYLKERLRSSIDKSIEVMQPPNAWTAVVRGAVMMGLARANSSLSNLSVTSRMARKHYGIWLCINFDSSVHEESQKYFSAKHRKYRIKIMKWFIKKGDPVEEEKPHMIRYNQKFAVKNGYPTSTHIPIECDRFSPTAPMYPGSNNATLVDVVANLRDIPNKDFDLMKVKLLDGAYYYDLKCVIEATFYSAYTKYILEIGGKRYNSVTAEYV